MFNVNKNLLKSISVQGNQLNKILNFSVSRRYLA